MVKNQVGGNRAKKQASKRSGKGGSSGRVRTTRLARAEGEVYAAVEKVHGGACDVTTYDGTQLHCVIRKKFKGRGKRDNLIRPGTWLLVGLYEWNKNSLLLKNKRAKCDLLEVYSDTDKAFLKQNEKTDLSKLSTIGVVNQEDIIDDKEIQFVDEDTTLYDEIMNDEKTENVVFSKDANNTDISSMSIEDIMDDI